MGSRKKSRARRANETQTIEEKVAALEKAVSGARRLAAIAAVIGALFGGGGAFGLIKWVVAAPLETAQARQQLLIQEQVASVGVHEANIASLQRSIEAAEKMDGGEDLARLLMIEMIQSEGQFRAAWNMMEKVAAAVDAKNGRWTKKDAADYRNALRRMQRASDRLSQQLARLRHSDD